MGLFCSVALAAARCGASGDQQPFLELRRPLLAWCLLPMEEAAGGGEIRKREEESWGGINSFWKRTA